MKGNFLDRLNELNNVPKEVLEDFILAERVWAGVNLFAILIGALFLMIRLSKRKEENDEMHEILNIFFIALFIFRVVFLGIMTGQFHDYILLFFSKQVYLVENFNISGCNW